MKFETIQDIRFSDTEVVVNAANGKGWLGGWLSKVVKLPGVSQSLNYATKGRLEKLAKAIAKTTNPKVGSVFVTEAPEGLKAKAVFHAVTMELPGQRSELEIVKQCCESIVVLMEQFGWKSITIPLLGCGTGRLGKYEVLTLYDYIFHDKDFKVVLAHPMRNIV